MLFLTRYLKCINDQHAIFQAILMAYSDAAKSCLPIDFLAHLKKLLNKKVNFKTLK